MLVYLLLPGLVTGALTLYALKRELKNEINREKNKLRPLSPEERLQYLKMKAREPRILFEPTVTRTVSKEMLDEEDFEKILKIMYPGLDSIEDWRRFCSSSRFLRYYLKGQY